MTQHQSHQFDANCENLIDNHDEEDTTGGFKAMHARRRNLQQTDVKYPASYLSPSIPYPTTFKTIERGLHNKDLIIRMLAEIFQVRKDENGQIRWQQISTSLVPISLYSRTTSKWLDYLLRASSIQTNIPTSAMSPDSRDFLILLQQFHQQTKPMRSSQNNTLTENFNQSENESIVFQVVAHDYIDGQFRKILNMKIRQPGARIGQASDYFIYYRENTNHLSSQAFHHQQFSASSFASSTSFMPQSQRATRKFHNPSLCTSRRGLFTNDEPRTWGLNFASINDAKLFYDVCSLNIVDLDFNSDYLKQLGDRQYQQQINTRYNIPVARNMQHHTQTRHKRNPNQSQHSTANHQGKNQTTRTTLRQQPLSNCAPCSQLINLDLRRTAFHESHLSDGDKACPVHGCNSAEISRERSRSVNRQLSFKKVQNQKRTRSFSTPASPELVQCPIHMDEYKQNTLCNLDITNCNEQRTVGLAQDLAPRKPMRGLLRLTQPADSQDSSVIRYRKRQKGAFQNVNHIETADSILATNTGPSNKSDRSECDTNPLQQRNSTKHSYLNQPKIDDFKIDSSKREVSHYSHRNQSSHLSDRNFVPTSTTTRRNFQCSQVGADTFDTATRRDARLARARYANSKNMKEFLSLDAGGLQIYPNQMKFGPQEGKRLQQKSPRDASNNAMVDATKGNRNSLRSLNDNKANQIADNLSFHKSYDKKLLGDDEKNHLTRPTGLGKNQFSVSTTTDDLPVNSLTKRRLRKLTSGDISEHAELQDISAVSKNNSETRLKSENIANRDEKLDRQTRAVSLGPDIGFLNNQKRTRGERSDTARRRSLERTMCVDLDAPLASNSYIRHSQLSPLFQSITSPTDQDCEPTQRNQVINNIPTNTHLVDVPHIEDVGLQTTFDCESNVDRVENNRRIIDIDEGALSDGANLRHDRTKYNARSSQRNQQHMSTFKSNPDVSDTNSRKQNHFPAPHPVKRHFRNTTDRTTIEEQTNQTLSSQAALHSILPQGRSYISSYAVPLCTTVRHSQQHLIEGSRQCRSCPNSLRRKQEPSSIPAIMTNLELNHSASRCDVHCTCATCTGIVDQFTTNRSPCEHNLETCGSRVCECLNRNGRPCDPLYSNLVNNQLHQSCCRYHCHFGQTAHHCGCHHLVNDIVSYNEHNSSHRQQSQSLRSYSNQSNRSTMRYGLYESDLEDEGKAGQILDQLDYRESLNRSRSEYFRPTIIKPVHGYDQTLARVTLKSRQRSKSQPPRGSIDTDNSFHLTKSMENVEKLIIEVQNELRALKRQPLGTAQIDMCAEKTEDCYVGQSGEQKEMSLKAGHQVEERKQGDGNKLLTTSSTRRAGQFKCVGAIRKAGFLSVKKWILKRRQSIELARKQGWKRYWVCLRGTALLFHSVIDTKLVGQQVGELTTQNETSLLSWIDTNCPSQTDLINHLFQSEHQQPDGCNIMSRDEYLKNMSTCYIEKEPKHLILIDGSIAQPIPEHPKRDFVFCLSTTFGDAYLFQASSQLDSENWVSGIHNACAASIARESTRGDAIKLFETKIKQIELEAEKKIFLRQRLESRLTSMSSMFHTNRTGYLDSETQYFTAGHDRNKPTIRTLLHQLNQQLLALDTYIEQLYCEVYQLRCYLSSCDNQNLFYQSFLKHETILGDYSRTNVAHNLPHPRTLLAHVSKPTKLLLIKMGIFTVSSFHAYIHARQDSAKSILQQIQRSSDNLADQQVVAPSLLELRVRSNSINKTFMSNSENVKLEAETENLLDLANLKTICIQLDKKLVSKIKQENLSKPDETLSFEISDDRCSIQDFDRYVSFNLKSNPSSTSSSLMKQLLKIIKPNIHELQFLNYYLRLVLDDPEIPKNDSNGYYVVKRKETTTDWSGYTHIEMLEKIMYRVELERSRTDENIAATFGISIEGQLFTTKTENLLNVYCNYIEWGSPADRIGLRDEDEILQINEVIVGDLDLMYVESIIQDASKLMIIVRSNRADIPSRAIKLDTITWQSFEDHDPDNGQDENRGHKNDLFHDNPQLAANNTTIPGGSQIISDEYLTTLVCPPPPTKSSAFFRTDSNILRQKSDLGMNRSECDINISSPITKSISQHRIVNMNPVCKDYNTRSQLAAANEEFIASGNVELANQLMQKTQGLTKLLNSAPSNDQDKISLSANLSSCSNSSMNEQNSCERLKKAILELVETEYAYIKHLETIVDHYMLPLEENNFLCIDDLRSFNIVLNDVVQCQQKFFSQLISKLAKDYDIDIDDPKGCDYERLNRVVQKTESIPTGSGLNQVLSSIAKIFFDEADQFRHYAAYCVAYSRLQKVLHPKKPYGSKIFHESPITSIPNALNTFSSAMQSSSITGFSSFNVQPRDSRLINLTNSSKTGDSSFAHLKQLNDFLSNLDSSSSSASFSLTKSCEVPSKMVTAKILKPSDASQSGSGSINSLSNSHKNVHQQNFESYLIKPIQRLVKYPMLLNSIVQVAQSQVDDAICIELQKAIKHLESVVNHVNDSQRVHDDYGIIFDRIEKQFFELQRLNEVNKVNHTVLSGPHQPPISTEIAQLIYYGPVDWLNTREFTSKVKKNMLLSSMVFVFTSCVIFICKEQIRSVKRKLHQKSFDNYDSQNLQGTNSRSSHWSSGSGGSDHYSDIIRYQTLIPVSEVQVRSVSQQHEDIHKFEWELFQCSSSNSNSSLLTKRVTEKATSGVGSKNNKGRVYLLANKSNEQRATFLRKIRFTIRDSVRNMSLPLIRSPSISKKLSTSSATSMTSNTNVQSTFSHTASPTPPEIDVTSGMHDSQAATTKCEMYPETSSNGRLFTGSIKVNS